MGPETLGRIINVIGEPVDECGPVGTLRAPGLLGNREFLVVQKVALGLFRWVPSSTPA